MRPTLRELDLMSTLDPYLRTALEFIWAFAEWWESEEMDELDISAVPGHKFDAMEQAFQRWLNQR